MTVTMVLGVVTYCFTSFVTSEFGASALVTWDSETLGVKELDQRNAGPIANAGVSDAESMLALLLRPLASLAIAEAESMLGNQAVTMSGVEKDYLVCKNVPVVLEYGKDGSFKRLALHPARLSSLLWHGDVRRRLEGSWTVYSVELVICGPVVMPLVMPTCKVSCKNDVFIVSTQFSFSLLAFLSKHRDGVSLRLGYPSVEDDAKLEEALGQPLSFLICNQHKDIVVLHPLGRGESRALIFLMVREPLEKK